MVKLWDDSLVKPLSIIFQNCINSSSFLDSWKKSNIVPIHKKNEKQITKDLSHLCQSVVEYLKESILIRFFNILKKINSLM